MSPSETLASRSRAELSGFLAPIAVNSSTLTESCNFVFSRSAFLASGAVKVSADFVVGDLRDNDADTPNDQSSEPLAAVIGKR